jgi:hypothetical protein
VRPLSCLNCCHNPLQLGPLGTSFGYCTRHRLVLNNAEATTCGHHLRKDLLFDSAARERATHRKAYPEGTVVLVTRPGTSAGPDLARKANGHLPDDGVVEQVRSYGDLGSRIATMAALHQIPGARAESAMLSLSRGYFRNCLAMGGTWTSGIHLLFWTLRRLDQDPPIAATDVRGPLAGSLEHTVALARWSLVALRLAFVGDVAQAALAEGDQTGRLTSLPGKAMAATAGGDADGLLHWLKASRPRWSLALSNRRYRQINEEIHAAASPEL